MWHKQSGWLLILLLFLSSLLQAQDSRGLLFRSYHTPINSRTSLHLSPEEPIEFNQTLSVSFNVSFWRVSELGYLLRFSSGEGTDTRIDLLYKPGVAEGIFKLSINGQTEIAEISIPEDQLVRNKWLKITVILDKQKGQLSLTINGQSASLKSPLIKTLPPLNPVFGMSPYGLPSAVATPRFGIKNLELSIDKTNYLWPLHKSNSATLSSESDSYDIEVNHPEWIIDTHQNWQQQHIQQARPMPGITFDNTTDDIYIVEEGLITVYNIANRSIQEFKPKNSFPKDQGTQYSLYSTQQKQLYGYDLSPAQAYTFNTSTEMWENPHPEENPLIYIWQHAPFENAINGNPMILGGYGFFAARNHLLEFNPSAKTWNEVPLKGDSLSPRSMLGITPGFQKGEYYVYGGYGNESGKQDLGFENLSDLYLLNLNDSTLKKLWELPPGSTPYLPSASMVLHPEDSAIYALGYAYLDGYPELELIKVSISEPSIEVIPLKEKLPFEIRNIGDYNLFLYYAAQTKELVSVLRINTDPNNAEVKIHTISYPPSAPTAMIESTESGIPWQLIIPGATLLVGLLIVLIKSRTRTDRTESIPAYTPLKTQPYNIQVLGEFKVTNPAGETLTQKLSPKLKELFLLILLHSLSDKKGISTKALTEILWPDASAASAKNNRGVNLQKLRQALSSLSSTEIIFTENKWTISFQKTSDCDLYHALQAIGQKDLPAMISIAQAGTLLPGTSYEWLDSFKVEIHFKLIQYLMSQAEVAKGNSEWASLVEISRAIFCIDPIHDEALNHLLKGLISLKKVSNAKAAYEQFTERYKHLYQEPYPILFDDILK